MSYVADTKGTYRYYRRITLAAVRQIDGKMLCVYFKVDDALFLSTATLVIFKNSNELSHPLGIAVNDEISDLAAV
jgi:hypothetical protein